MYLLTENFLTNSHGCKDIHKQLHPLIFQFNKIPRRKIQLFPFSKVQVLVSKFINFFFHTPQAAQARTMSLVNVQICLP